MSSQGAALEGDAHVIVLVDAGMPERSSEKEARRQAVEVLEGGWTEIPTRKRITVHHSGVGSASQSLARLDLRRDFLRTKLHLAQNLPSERLLQQLVPGARYRYGSTRWATALALADAKVDGRSNITCTFLLKLSPVKPASDHLFLRKRFGVGLDKEARYVDEHYGFRLIRTERIGSGNSATDLTLYEVEPKGEVPPPPQVKSVWTGVPWNPRLQILSEPSRHVQSVRALQLPRGPGMGMAEVTLAASRKDPWLGQIRALRTYRVPFRVGPHPLAGLWETARWLAIILLSLGAGVIVAWLFRMRRRSMALRLHVPGAGGWISLQGHPGLSVRSPHGGLRNAEALRIALPPHWARRLWMRGTCLNLPEGTPLRWRDHESLSVPIEAFGREAVATWNADPAYAVTARISIRRDGKEAEAQIEYPRPRVVRTSRLPKMKYHVALDLGSDSMAAYFSSDREARMVPLQEFAPLTVTNRRPDYLKTQEPGGESKVSPRLRSRIALSSNQTSPNLSEGHATLDFFDVSQAEPMLLDGYRQSIFDFWQPELTPPLVNSTLPNPKVMFQYGVEDAFPAARTLSGEAMNLTPETVVAHLTVQVLRNLVLRSSPLRKIDPSEVEVVLTVPNVYSVEHAEKLRETVERLAGVGRVTTISESDALAYYYLAERRPALKVRNAPERVSSEPTPITQILTIDVGRGTTDLSLIQTQQVDREERVWVRARTGRSSGGGELTYLFVSFYEREIRRIYREHGELLAYRSDALTRLQNEPPMSFLWLKNRALADADPMYAKAFYAMAELVECVKRDFGEHYLLKTSATAQEHIKTIVDALMRFTEYAFIDVPNWKEAKAMQIEEFRRHLESALNVSAQLGTGRTSVLSMPLGMSVKDEVGGWWQRTVSGFRGSRKVAVKELPAPKALPVTDRTNLDWLAREVREYVRTNVHHLLVELSAMVASDPAKREFANCETLDERLEVALRTLVEPGRTHVVVGGQASQFGPLKKALHSIFRPMEGEEIASLTMLVGQDAKNACCQGAVIYATSGHQPQNRDALHGSYGFIDIARTEDAAVYPIDTISLNEEGLDRVETPTNVSRYLVFTPGSFGTLAEEIDDAMLSRLGRFKGLEYKVTYAQEEGDPIRRLKVDGQEVRLSTFGDIKDNIWKKVWPDQLPREPQE